jgi:hypothetical protein
MKVIRVLWSEGGLATILARSLEGTRTGSVIYRLGADIDSSQILFQGIDEKVIDLVGSPLSTNMAIVYENGVSVRRSLDFQSGLSFHTIKRSGPYGTMKQVCTSWGRNRLSRRMWPTIPKAYRPPQPAG